jgi:hypothetical protein
MELGQNGSFREMLYTKLERLEATVEDRSQFADFGNTLRDRLLYDIQDQWVSRKHDISRSKISPSTQDLDPSLFEDPGKAREFSKQTSPSYYPR